MKTPDAERTPQSNSHSLVSHSDTPTVPAAPAEGYAPTGPNRDGPPKALGEQAALQQQVDALQFMLNALYCDIRKLQENYDSLKDSFEQLGQRLQNERDEKEAALRRYGLPPLYRKARATHYWNALADAGYLDPHYQPTEHCTHATAACIAFEMSNALTGKTQWVPFSKLWKIPNLHTYLRHVAYDDEQKIKDIFK